METIFDLPAHPLMVHFPVVAIPVLALLGLVMAARPRFREHYSLPVLALGVITVVATFMAARSGEALVESFGLSDEFIDPHRDLGNMLRFFVLGLTLAIGAMVAVNKRATSTGTDPLAIVAAVVVVGFSLLSLVWTVRTGHEGAKAVWGSGETSSDDDPDEIDVTTAAAAPDPTTAPTTADPTTAAPPTSQAAETSEPISETAAPADSEPSSTTEPAAAGIDGQEVYESNCARCHRADGSGGRGPSLQGLAIEEPDPADAIEQTTEGGGGMPAFGARLDAAEIDAAVAYIYATF